MLVGKFYSGDKIHYVKEVLDDNGNVWVYVSLCSGKYMNRVNTLNPESSVCKTCEKMKERDSL